MVGIYKIVNTITGKSYIGQSVDIKRRWAEHKARGRHPDKNDFNSALYSAFSKYGIENFSFEVVEECKVEELNDKENYYISIFNTLTPNGYNLVPGGNQKISQLTYCCDCGKIISSGSIRCVNCYHKFCKADRPEPVVLAKLILDFGFEEIGRRYCVTGNAIKKWCKAYNIPYKKQDLKEWYISQTGADLDKVKKKRDKPVAQIDLSTNKIIQVYPSTASAARAVGANYGSHIGEVCNHIHDSAYGYGWKWI